MPFVGKNRHDVTDGLCIEAIEQHQQGAEGKGHVLSSTDTMAIDYVVNVYFLCFHDFSPRCRVWDSNCSLPGQAYCDSGRRTADHTDGWNRAAEVGSAGGGCAGCSTPPTRM